MGNLPLYIVKIGGNVIDNPDQLAGFLKKFTALPGRKILVHGGGKIATRMAADLGIEAKMVDGRRITDGEMLRVVTMVYAGLTNKQVVAQLQAGGCNAIGLSGADGNMIAANKRPVKDIDYGWVGDLHEASVNREGLSALLDSGFTPVFSAITHDGNGNLLNTNADTIASALAVAMSAVCATALVYCFEKKGVLRDVNDAGSVIREIPSAGFEQLKAEGVIADGMIPKLYNAFNAIESGVGEVYIGQADDLHLMGQGQFGTRLVK